MARLVSLERVGPLSPDEGLGDADVAARRARWGTNELLQVPGRSWADVARDTARDPMLWFLVATGAVYAALGEVVEALTLLGAAGPLVAMDSYLHRRTRASLAALGSALAAEARVVRAGAERRVPPADLVPGDLVLLGPGDAVPADGLVVAADGLQVDESTLTGESLPERKRPATPPRAAGPEVPVEDAAWVSAGTRVLAGRARVRVALTGAETLYGQIVRQAVGGGGATTPLQAAVRQLVLVLLGAALLLCGALALVRLRQGAGLLDALVSAATLAVAALPEEFPVAVTVFLGVGVFRLARRRALVRRAVTVETIGRVTVICTDKTGTITEGRLRVAHLLPAGGTPEALLSLVALACDPESGDPLDEAIADASARQGLEPTAAEALAAFPFTEDRRRATRVLRRGGADLLAVTKGAPEVVLAATQLARDEQAAWAARTTELAASGHKVVACAWRPLQDWAGGEPDRGLTFAGLVALEDPVRAGVAEAVRGCRAAGIHVVMVTGDHPGTAAAVAREVGLGGPEPVVVTGDALEAALGRGERDLRGLHVVARARPLQKLALVRALQAAGEHVAVTGDGVNDVPALQAADVGIALGPRAARTAREVAAIVLLDEDFGAIVRAVAEGRQLFRNLQLSFAYLLVVHVPLVLTATLVPLAGLPLLYLPVHVVWLETLIHPTALLVFQELPSAEALGPRGPPRRARFFSPGQWAGLLALGLLLTVLVLLLHHRSLGPGHEDVEHARAMALVCLSVTSAALAALLSGLRTWTARVVVAVTVLGTAALVQAPWTAALLHVTPLHGADWALAVGGPGLLVAAALLTWGRRAGLRPPVR